MLKCILLLLPLTTLAQGQAKTTIVFVCEHGGARSTIASAYFNKLARESGLPYQSIFRGLTPDSAITKETARGLKADGLNTASLSPAALSAEDVSENTLLISLDCTAPSTFQTYRAWKGIPPISENYAAARSEIVRLLNLLIDELKNKKNNHQY